MVVSAKIFVAATKILFVVPNFVAVTKPFFRDDSGYCLVLFSVQSYTGLKKLHRSILLRLLERSLRCPVPSITRLGDRKVELEVENPTSQTYPIPFVVGGGVFAPARLVGGKEGWGARGS